MIDYDKYQFHIDVIGSKEEFIKHIEEFKKAAPYYTEEDIKTILDDEQERKIGPSFWNRPWM